MKTSKARDTRPGFFFEVLLWILASLWTTVLAVGGMHLLKSSLPWWVHTLCMSLTLGLTVTWGSWASLLWTRNRVLRSVIGGITLVPGMLLLALSALGMCVGWGAWYVWLGLAMPSIGTVAAALLLGRQGAIAPQGGGTPVAPLVVGLTIFPLLSGIAALFVSSLWWQFISGPYSSADWRTVFSLTSGMVTLFATILITTIIPAVVSRLCSQLCARLR